MSEFERSDQLLLNENDLDNGENDDFPIWIINVIISIVIVFAIIIISIFYLMRKNKQSREL